MIFLVSEMKGLRNKFQLIFVLRNEITEKLFHKGGINVK